MTLPRVENETDFVAQHHLLVDKDGEKLCMIVKATLEHEAGPPRGPDGTFSVAPKVRRRAIRAADVPWGKPEVASIRYPSDLCVRKPGTDVIVVARAFAPLGEAVPRFDCGVRVGGVSKVVRVTGPRVWAAGGDSITEPRPIGELDVRYDYAFGGFDDSDPENPPIEDARNPVGRGIARNAASLDAAAAPQLEDPLDPVRSASSRPKPAALGAVGRHFEPRRSRWGTYDAKWLENRAPLPPPDFDDRANLAATPELIATPPFQGGEPGALTNLTPGGALSFVLPRIRLIVTFSVAGTEPVTLRPYVDTVVLDSLGPIEHRALAAKDPEFPPPPAGPLTVELVWRAAVVAPRRLADATILVKEERAS